MSALASGITLVVLTFVFCGIQIGVHPFVKKITNSYLFWIILASIMLIYFIAARYAWDCSALNDYNHGIRKDYGYTDIDYTSSFLKAKVFLTDLCPFFFVCSCISLIAQPSRKVAVVLATPMIFGSLLTLFTSIMLGDGGRAEMSGQYIFLGSDPYRLKFFMHFLGLVLGVGVLLNTPSNKWWTFLWTNVACLIFFIHITIIAYAYDVHTDVCGIRQEDWLPNTQPYGTNASFYPIGKIFSFLSFPWLIFIPLLVCYGVISLFMYLHYIIQKKVKFFTINNSKSKEPIWFGYYKI